MENSYLQGLLAKAQFETLGNQSVDKKWMRDQIKLLRNDVQTDDKLNSAQAKLYLDFFDSFDTLVKDANDVTFGGGFKGDLLKFSKIDVNREHEGPITPFQTTFSQAMLWGMLTCTVTFSISIVKERTSGTFDRLRIGPLGHAHILGGKGLACFITAIFVICVLYVIAKAIFKMPIGNLFLIYSGGVLYGAMLCWSYDVHKHMGPHRAECRRSRLGNNCDYGTARRGYVSYGFPAIVAATVQPCQSGEMEYICS